MSVIFFLFHCSASRFPLCVALSSSLPLILLLFRLTPFSASIILPGSLRLPPCVALSFPPSLILPSALSSPLCFSISSLLFHFIPLSLVVPLYINSGTEYNNSSVGEQEEFAMRYAWAALLDWQVTRILSSRDLVPPPVPIPHKTSDAPTPQLWLHILIYMSIMTPRKHTPPFLPSHHID